LEEGEEEVVGGLAVFEEEGEEGELTSKKAREQGGERREEKVGWNQK